MSFVGIDIEELTQALNLLANNPYVIISDEPKDSPIQKAFQLVTLAFTILRETKYDVMYDILEKLPRPTYLKPESAGAFLFGDYLMCYGDVKQHCSPLSLSGVPRRKSSKTFTKNDPCPHQVWLLKKGHNGNRHYAAIISSNSKKAMVFIDTADINNFKGFNESEIYLLKENGVESVEVYSVGNPNHNTIIQNTKLDDLLINDLPQIEETNNISDEVKESESESNLWLWLIIIGIIIVIILIIYGYKYDNY